MRSPNSLGVRPAALTLPMYWSGISPCSSIITSSPMGAEALLVSSRSVIWSPLCSRVSVRSVGKTGDFGPELLQPEPNRQTARVATKIRVMALVPVGNSVLAFPFDLVGGRLGRGPGFGSRARRGWFLRMEVPVIVIVVVVVGFILADVDVVDDDTQQVAAGILNRVFGA